jgi:hypothetical protein
MGGAPPRRVGPDWGGIQRGVDSMFGEPLCECVGGRSAVRSRVFAPGRFDPAGDRTPCNAVLAGQESASLEQYVGVDESGVEQRRREGEVLFAVGGQFRDDEIVRLQAHGSRGFRRPVAEADEAIPPAVRKDRGADLSTPCA